MSKHTKGPWHIVEGRTHGSIEVFSGETAIAEMWSRGNKNLEMANARRIVACVNACEGFSLEELQGANLFKDSIESQSEIIALKKQRDELLESLQYWLPSEIPFQHQTNDAICQAHSEQWNAARTAIAKAVGDVS